MPLVIEGKKIATSKEGFLQNQKDWNPQVSQALAEAHGVQMTDAHWEIIQVLRDFCDRGNEPPSMRHFSAEIKQQLEPEKAKSIYLMKLFGSSPAKMAARLAGLPKPKNCL